jgi:hypothetical protein
MTITNADLGELLDDTFATPAMTTKAPRAHFPLNEEDPRDRPLSVFFV